MQTRWVSLGFTWNSCADSLQPSQQCSTHWITLRIAFKATGHKMLGAMLVRRSGLQTVRLIHDPCPCSKESAETSHFFSIILIQSLYIYIHIYIYVYTYPHILESAETSHFFSIVPIKPFYLFKYTHTYPTKLVLLHATSRI